jgi:DNA gyrase inhibitor GyrI
MKGNTLVTLTIIVLVIGAAGFWLVSNSRAATETPEYKVIRTDGKFEIRDYPALTLAGTSMEGADMDGSFMRLFRFISGTNKTAEKIEMTAPVLIDSTPEKRTMSFIMPKKTVEKGVPKPSGDKVALGEIEAARFAVFRFDGGRSAENEKKAADALSQWLETKKLTAKGAPMFAYYDPPWTPTFMRRNEVMVRLAK